jgi:hypothetical protein
MRDGSAVTNGDYMAGKGVVALPLESLAGKTRFAKNHILLTEIS